MTAPTPLRTGRRAGPAQFDEAAADRRYYDFRTQLRVVDTGDWLERLEATGRAWLAEKRIQVSPGVPAAVRSDTAEARIDRLTSGNGGALRLTLAENGAQGTWLTEILAVGEPGRGGRISVSVRNSESRFVNRPRIVPRLLEDIEVLDGNSELVDDTWVISGPHMREFLRVLGDPARNAPVFVTAAHPGADLRRVQSWMAERTREVAGLAHSYVLDAESHAALMAGLGQAMGIKAGSIRSYAPRPMAHDPEDALRHRTIGALRLESLHPRAAAALVGRIARFEAASRPEPLELRDARRSFDRKALDERFRRRTTGHVRPVESRPDATPSAGEERPVLAPQEPSPALPPRPTPVPPVEETDPGAPPSPVQTPGSLIDTPRPGADQDEAGPPVEHPVAEPTASTPLTPAGDTPTEADPPRTVDTGETGRRSSDVVDEAAPAHAVGEQLPPGTAALLEKFTELTGTTDLAEAIDAFQLMNQLYEEAGERARDDLRERERLADEAAEHELTAKALELELSGELTRRRTAESNLRLLQVYNVPEEPDAARQPHPSELTAPELFSDLPDTVRALETYVQFTGDPRLTAELDEYDHAGLGVKRCWEGLIALHDYARSTVDGAHKGSFHDYLRATPDGYSPFPPSHHAAMESESTMEKKEFARQRTLKVPESVHPSGYVEMWAHLKLLKVGRISPRLHFYDDAAGTGKVYVGYIGRHLGVSSS